MLLRKDYLIAVIAIFLFALTTNAERMKRMYALCPPNFIRVGSECYYISTESVNWLDAHFECKDRNSRLAEPIKHEDRTIRKFFMHSNQQDRSDIWIGGIYNWERKKWQWGYGGRDVAYQSFSQMSPGSSQDLRFHCAVLNPELKYRWSARSCVDKHQYICQHRMPYVSEKNRQRIYNKWNETYPNQMANEILLTEEELQLNENRRQQRLNQRQKNLNKNRNHPTNNNVNVNDDRHTNSIDWQPQTQPQQQPPKKTQQQSQIRNNRRRQRQRNQRKRIPNNFNPDVDNNIGDVNNNRVSDNTFHLDNEYGLRPAGRHNRTKNPNYSRNNDLFGPPRRGRKNKNRTTTATTRTTTTTTPTPTTFSTTYPSTRPPVTAAIHTKEHPVIRYLDHEPTSAEERYRMENEQVRMQEEVARRERQEDKRRQHELALREKQRQEVDQRRLEIEDREHIQRQRQFMHERKREEEALLRQQDERKRLEHEQDKIKREHELREQMSNSAEEQRQREQNETNAAENEENRQPIEDKRIENLRIEEDKKQRRNELRKRLQKLSPDELKEFYQKRAERNKKRGAKKRDAATTSIPNQ